MGRLKNIYSTFTVNGVYQHTSFTIPQNSVLKNAVMTNVSVAATVVFGVSAGNKSALNVDCINALTMLAAENNKQYCLDLFNHVLSGGVLTISVYTSNSNITHVNLWYEMPN